MILVAVSTTEIVDRIFSFCEMYAYGNSGNHFFPYQAQFAKRIIRSLLENDGEEISALFARQSGKSETVSIIAGGCAVILPILANLEIFKDDKRLKLFKNGMLIGIFAPALHQAQITFTRLKGYMATDLAQAMFADPDINVVFDTNNGQNIVIRMANINISSIITCMSASEGSNIEGKSYQLIIVDEAQDVSNHKYLKCLAEDTEVWLADGSKKTIREIVQKKLNVITLDGERTPSEFHDNGEQEVFEVTLDNGRTIQATSNHQFFVRRRKGNRIPKWDTLSSIAIGDTIATPKSVSYFGEGNYTKQQGIITGLMLGDGCLSGDIPIFCCLPEVKKYLPYVTKDFDVTFHEYTYNEKNNLSEGAFVRNTRKGNKENSLITFFKELGIWGLKGENKTITPKIFSANKEFLWGLVVGLIESDGCISNNEICFANISEGLVRGLQDILLKFGIPSRVSTRVNTNSFGTNSKDLWILTIKSYEGIYNFYCTFEMGSKQDKLEILMGKVYHKGEKQRNKYTDTKRSKFRKDIYFNRVVSIKSRGIKHTYCLTVEGRNFIANGIVSSNSISPMGAFYNATKILIGTPTSQKGFFFASIQRNVKEYLNGYRKRNHFEYNYEFVSKYNANYAKYIAGEKRRIGEDLDEFQMSYNLKWLFERGMFVVPDKFEALGIPSMNRVLLDTKKNHVVGIDCGKRTDSTIVTVGEVDWDNPIIIEQSSDPTANDYIVYDTTVVDWLEILGDNWDEQYYLIMSYLSNFKIKKIVIDATGVGSPIADRLAANVDCEVEPYVFSTSSKSVLYKHYDSQIKQGRFHFPAHDDVLESREYKRFIAQHLDLQKSYMGQNMVVAHPPEKGAHDDYPDSSALMCWGARGEVSRPETSDNNPLLSRNTSGYNKSRNRITAKRGRR